MCDRFSGLTGLMEESEHVQTCSDHLLHQPQDSPHTIWPNHVIATEKENDINYRTFTTKTQSKVWSAALGRVTGSTS